MKGGGGTRYLRSATGPKAWSVSSRECLKKKNSATKTALRFDGAEHRGPKRSGVLRCGDLGRRSARYVTRGGGETAAVGPRGKR